MRWFRGCINPSRQISDHKKVDVKKAEILSRIKSNGAYYVPVGFALETGALGATLLHQALRELKADGVIRCDGLADDHGWFEKWQMVES
jgi:hypothetical protein